MRGLIAVNTRQRSALYRLLDRQADTFVVYLCLEDTWPWSRMPFRAYLSVGAESAVISLVKSLSSRIERLLSFFCLVQEPLDYGVLARQCRCSARIVSERGARGKPLNDEDIFIYGSTKLREAILKHIARTR